MGKRDPATTLTTPDIHRVPGDAEPLIKTLRMGKRDPLTTLQLGRRNPVIITEGQRTAIKEDPFAKQKKPERMTDLRHQQANPEVKRTKNRNRRQIFAIKQRIPKLKEPTNEQ
jgi:hypothetical protein